VTAVVDGLAASGATVVSAESRINPAAMTVEYVVDDLECGAKLIVAPLAARQSVGVSFALNVGSRFESDANAGLAHFIEHMVFKGTSRFPTSADLSKAIEGVGGVLNAVTDREQTVFWTRVPANHLAQACTVLGEMLRRPLFDENEVVKERAVVVEELRMYADSPQDHVQTLFDQVMWPGHPLGRDVAGSETTVNTFTAQHCREHLDTYYRPENAVITVAGAVDVEHCRGIAGEVVSGWTANAAAPAKPLPAKGVSGKPLRHDKRKIEQTNIVLGMRGPSYFDKDRYAVDVLNVILGEGMSSRLFLHIREDLGLAYDVHSFTSRLSDTGALGIGIGCDPGRAVAAAAASLGELHKLAQTPVPGDELEKAKSYTTGRLQLQLESTSGLGSFLGQQQLLTGEILTPEEIVERINAVTAEEVQAAAAVLSSREIRAAVVGPISDPAGFESAISATTALAEVVNA
jgi:predicted Zn-dependent peptidase